MAKKTKKKARVQRRQYLEGLKGYNPSTGWGAKRDDREPRWAEQRASYGFDDRQTWSLDSVMVELLYERLQMFLEVADRAVELDGPCCRFKGRDYTRREAIEELLRLGKIVLEDRGINAPHRASRRFWKLWSKSYGAMWW